VSLGLVRFTVIEVNVGVIRFKTGVLV